MKVGDRVTLIDISSNYLDDFNDLHVPLELHNIYKISRILEYLKTGVCRYIQLYLL